MLCAFAYLLSSRAHGICNDRLRRTYTELTGQTEEAEYTAAGERVEWVIFVDEEKHTHKVNKADALRSWYVGLSFRPAQVADRDLSLPSQLAYCLEKRLFPQMQGL